MSEELKREQEWLARALGGEVQGSGVLYVRSGKAVRVDLRLVDDEPPPPIPDETKELFEAVGAVAEGLCLMSGRYRGQNVTYLCQTHRVSEGEIDLWPVAIMVDSTFLSEDMTDSRGETPQRHEDEEATEEE